MCTHTAASLLVSSWGRFDVDPIPLVSDHAREDLIVASLTEETANHRSGTSPTVRRRSNIPVNRGRGIWRSSSEPVRIALDFKYEILIFLYVEGSPDGAYSESIILDSAGNLYGITQFGGGSSSNCPDSGCGVATWSSTRRHFGKAIELPSFSPQSFSWQRAVNSANPAVGEFP